MQLTAALPGALRRPRRGILLRIAVTLAVGGLMITLAGTQALASWREATVGAYRQGGFSRGAVLLTNGRGARPMFSLSDLAPGNTATSFIRIGYGGSLPAGVRIYDSVHESGLARFLHLTITRGSRAGHAFKADATDYVGAGAGVLFDGRLARFPESFAGGVADPRTWHPTDGHTYRVEMTLRGGEAAMGLSAGPTFVWEARQAAGGP